MKFKNVLASLAFVGLAAVASATPVKITNADAMALFNALNAVQPGLSAANVGFAAQDIWNLKGVSEAFTKEQIRVSRDSERNKTAHDLDGDTKLQASWDHFRETEITVDLVLFSVTEDEIKEAKITPGLLAPILHYLSPQTAAKK